MLQHVRRALPGSRRRGRICRAHGVGPAAVEHVVEVEVDAQADLVDGEALRQLEVQLFEVVLAVVRTFAYQVDSTRCHARPGARANGRRLRARDVPRGVEARTGAAVLDAAAELERAGQLNIPRQRVRTRRLEVGAIGVFTAAARRAVR